MTHKKAIYTVAEDLSGVFRNSAINPEMNVVDALEIVVKQMKTTGYRERTLYDYELHISHFIKITGVTNLSDITIHHIYEWLESMKVSNGTKLTRLKCLKAFFSRCHKLGWFSVQFWSVVKIKVDIPVKVGATDQDVNALLGLLDLKDFFQLRDAAAVLTMYQTGVRVGTVTKITEEHIDLEAQMFRIPGSIVKNHEELILPFDNVLAQLLVVLYKQNALVRQHNGVRNKLIFITRQGGSCQTTPTNNIIGKRITTYAKQFNLKNVNPHALRRGFAMNLRKKGAHISLISKALGHSDLAVTTRYLHYDKLEVAEDLRKFL
ncbi:tyrosine-type recombinase/integrase [Psychrobacillus sp. FSL K6-1415]|uniref:tyrosine-type recombinase/integrase n=1 Tax=Psychrobacillus sp. FSL K6-1415 TaxID=2921544 RepID=UPI0030F6AC80